MLLRAVRLGTGAFIALAVLVLLGVAAVDTYVAYSGSWPATSDRADSHAHTFHVVSVSWAELASGVLIGWCACVAASFAWLAFRQ